MFAIQRTEKILELLEEKGIVYVNDLVNIFDVSDVTIRKDLNKLSDEGLVTKTHGGAVLNHDYIDSSEEIIPDDPSIHPSHLKKEKLAASAYPFIHKGDTIFLGSGYTCAALAKHIKKSDDISVVTNNLEAALILKEKCRTLILIGGEVIVHGDYTFTTKPQIRDFLKSFNINKAITSSSSIDEKFGVSVSTEVSLNIMKAVLEVASKWYLIVDEDKFGQVSPYKIADIDEVDVIISDLDDEEYSKHTNIITI